MRKLILQIILTLLFILSGLGGPIENLMAQENDPLFSLLNSEQTGIHFNNLLEDTKEHNIMIYSNYYGGAGVGVGDLNNDGLADIYFAGNLAADQVYLNKGNFEFEDITVAAGIVDNGGWSSGIIMADVNQDGWLDIYVTRELYDDQPELRKNKLYINNGFSKSTGQISFSEKAAEYNVADSERTRHATFLDYDNDLDLYVVSGGNEFLKNADAYLDRLYINDGTGQFSRNESALPDVRISGSKRKCFFCSLQR